MIVVLDNIRSAHNVGAIIRTCDALGIKEIHLCGITPDPRENKKVIKTSLGAEKNIKIINNDNILPAIKKVKIRGYKIIGLEISPTSIPLSSLDKYSKTALVVGNEVSGLSEKVIESCDCLVQIPMKGIKESLNVSVAFGIAAYEIINK